MLALTYTQQILQLQNEADGINRHPHSTFQLAFTELARMYNM